MISGLLAGCAIKNGGSPDVVLTIDHTKQTGQLTLIEWEQVRAAYTRAMSSDEAWTALCSYAGVSGGGIGLVSEADGGSGGTAGAAGSAGSLGFDSAATAGVGGSAGSGGSNGLGGSDGLGGGGLGGGAGASTCPSVVEQCVDTPPESFEELEGVPHFAIGGVDLTACEVTVGELEACLDSSVQAMIDAYGAASCLAPVASAVAVAPSELSECETLVSDCPGLVSLAY